MGTRHLYGWLIPDQPDIHLPLDVAPFLGLAQAAQQSIEVGFMLRRVFEPGQEIERFGQFPAVMQTTRNRWQIFQADRDMTGLLLDDRTPFV